MLSRATVSASAFLRASRAQAARSLHATPVSRNDAEAADAVVEEEASEGFFSASLGDYNRAVPLGALFSIPFIANNWYIMNEETQILGCFCLFTGSIYSLFGDAIGAHFDEDGKAIMAEHNAIEDANIAAVDTVKDAHVIAATAAEDVAAIGAATKVLQAEIAKAKTAELKAEVRANFVRKLDSIVAQEAALRDSLQASVVDAAAAHVTAQFADGKGSADAFQSAMDALAGKPAGEDAVSAAFTSYLKGFGDRLAGAANQDTALPEDVVAAVQDDMDALLRRENLRLEVKAPASVKLGDF